MKKRITRSVRVAKTAAVLVAVCGANMSLYAGGGNVKVQRVVRGHADITQNGALTTIRVGKKTIINYDRFNIPAGSELRFIQPTKNSRVLNRVLGGTPSKIDGALSANGIVYIVNPSGVIFGPNSTLNVGGLYAAAGAISDKDFIRGVNHFTDVRGEVVNRGLINADRFAHLIGSSIRNEGAIRSSSGIVSLSAGEDVFLANRGSKLMVRVDQNAEGSATPVADRPAIENSGTIDAQDVGVTVGDIYSLALGNSGSVTADRGSVTVKADGDVANSGVIRAREGSVHVNAGDGVVDVSGSIDVSGPGAGETGGRIELTGGEVRLTGADVNASGDMGGGVVLLGGDVLGRGALATSDFTTVDAASSVRADALTIGDGGLIVVWSDMLSSVQGQLSARGGRLMGDGGFVETSSKLLLDIDAAPMVGAFNGASGHWLIDPNNIEILGAGTTNAALNNASPNFGTNDDSAVLGVDVLYAALSGGANVTVMTNSNGANLQAGDITLSVPLDLSLTTGDNTLNFIADNSIFINEAIGNAVGQSLNLNLTAATDVNINNAIDLNGGAFTSISDAFNVGGLGSVLASDVAITTDAIDITVGGTLSALNDMTIVQRSALRPLMIDNLSDPATMLAFNQDEIDALSAGGALLLGGPANPASMIASSGVNFDENVVLRGATVSVGGPVTGTGTVQFSSTLGTSVAMDVSGVGVSFDDNVILADGSNVTIDGGAGVVTFGGSVSGFALGASESLLVQNASSVALGGPVSGAGGAADATGLTDVTLASDVTATALTIDVTGNVALGSVSATAAAGDAIHIDAGAVTLDGSTYETGGGAVDVTAPVTLTMDTEIRTNGGDVDFDDTITGAGLAFTIDAGAGALTLPAGADVSTGAVDFTAGVTSLASNVDSNGAAIDVTTDDLTLTGALTATGETVRLMTLTADQVAGVEDAAQTFNVTNADLAAIAAESVEVISTGAAGAMNVAVDADLTLDGKNYGFEAAGGILVDGNVTTTGAAGDGAVTFTGPVDIAGGGVTIDTTNGGGSAGGDVRFAAAVDSTSNDALTVDAGAGAVDFDANVGDANALASLDATGGAINVESAHTTGGQNYTGATNVGDNADLLADSGDVTIDGALRIGADVDVEATTGNVRFRDTVDSDAGESNALAATAGGDVFFEGEVGQADALASLTTNATATEIRRDLTTDGAQDYNSDVRLLGDGANSTEIVSTGGGTIDIQGDAVIGNPTQFVTVESVGGAVAFNGLLDAAAPDSSGLTVRGGTVDLVMDTGSLQPLACLTIDAGVANVRNVTVAGAFESLGGSLTLNGTTINALGTSVLCPTSGVVLNNLVLTGPLTIIQTGGGAGDDITVNGTVDGTVAGVSSLILNAGGGGNVLVCDVIGGVAALNNFGAAGFDVELADIGTVANAGVQGLTAVNAANDLRFKGGTYHANTQIYSSLSLFDHMVDGGNKTFTSDSGSILFGGAGETIIRDGLTVTMNSADDIQFNGRIFGDTTGGGLERLTLAAADRISLLANVGDNATDGFVVPVAEAGRLGFLSADGATVRVQSVRTDVTQVYNALSGGELVIEGSVLDSSIGGIAIGSALFPATTTLANDVSITSGNNQDVLIVGTVDSDGTPRMLFVDAGAGDILLDGDVGLLGGLAGSRLQMLTANGDRIRLGGDIRTVGPVLLNGATLLDDQDDDRVVITTDNSDVTLNGAIDAEQAAVQVDGLMIDAGTGVASLNGDAGLTGALAFTDVMADTINLQAVTSTGDQDYVAATVNNLRGDLTTTGGGDVTVTGDAVLVGDADGVITVTTDNAVDGNVVFNNRVDASAPGGEGLAVAAGDGTATFEQEIGFNTDLSNLDVTASMIFLNGGLVDTTLDQRYNGPTLLGADTTMNGSTITFENALDSDSIATPRDLTINGALGVVFNGDVGSNALLRNLTVTAPDILSTAGFAGSTTSLTYNGGRRYAMNFVEQSDVIRFNGRVDATVAGGADLTVNATTLAAFEQQVGGVNPLRNLMVNSPAIEINGGEMTTTLDQVYNGAVQLGTSAVATGEDITFIGTVNAAAAGGPTLQVDASNSARFDSAVGDIAELSNLTVNATTINLNGGLVNTLLDQFYNGSSVLGAATVMNGQDVTFNGILNGAQSLTLNGDQSATFNGAVGGVTPLTMLTVNAPVINLNGGLVSTTDDQFFNGDSQLGAGVTHNGENVTFNGDVDGGQAMVVNANAAATFEGEVGGGEALDSLEVNADVINVNGGLVATSGDQDYNGPTVLGAGTTMSGDDITFADTLDSDGTARNLTVNGNGVTTFEGEVGGDSPLDALVTSANGQTVIGDDVTADAMTFNDATSADANIQLEGFSSVTFNSTLNGAGFDVTVLSPVTTFNGQVTDMGTLNTDADGETRIGTDLIEGDELLFDDDVVLTANVPADAVLIDAANQAVFGGMINGTGNDLTVNAPTTVFMGMVFGIDELMTDAAGVTDVHSDVMARTAFFGDQVRIVGDSVMTGTESVIFDQLVEGVALSPIDRTDLTVNAPLTEFRGGVSNMGSLMTDAGGTTLVGDDVQTFEGATFGDDVIVANDLTIADDGSGSLLFVGSIDTDGVARDLMLRVTELPGDPVPPTIGFGGSVGVNGAFDNLMLGGDFGAAPIVATIIAAPRNADGTVNAAAADAYEMRFVADEITMGDNQKVIALGDLAFDAATRATLGDMAALNDLSVTSPQIIIPDRVPADYLFINADGAGVLAEDRGPDVVAGGKMKFSSRPRAGIDAGGQAFGRSNAEFALQNPRNFSDTLDRVTLTLLQDRLEFTDFQDAAGAGLGAGLGMLSLDIASNGPQAGNLGGIEGAAALEQQADDGEVTAQAVAGAVVLQALLDLEIPVREAGIDTLRDSVKGFAAYEDASLTPDQLEPTTINRVPSQAAKSLVYAFASITHDEAALAEGRIDVRNADLGPFQSNLYERWLSFEESIDDADSSRETSAQFRTYLDVVDESLSEQLAALGRALDQLHLMGLTPAEYARARESIMNRVSPFDIETMETIMLAYTSQPSSAVASNESLDRDDAMDEDSFGAEMEGDGAAE